MLKSSLQSYRKTNYFVYFKMHLKYIEICKDKKVERKKFTFKLIALCIYIIISFQQYTLDLHIRSKLYFFKILLQI